MTPGVLGVFWCIAFVVLEAVQYVYFGGIFQRVSSFQFGFLVFGISSTMIIAWALWKAPAQIGIALRNARPLIAVNIAATLAWCAYLTSVQLIEPAVAYTIGAGVMPLTAIVAYRFGVPEGERVRNAVEGIGNLLLLAAILLLSAVTFGGWSGFVRGGPAAAVAGVALAVADGVLFTWMLIYCQRLGRAGVGPTVVFGIRFPLYIVTAGALSLAGLDHKDAIPATELAVVVLIGMILTVPPLYALQRAVALISTLTIGAVTALGPFVIFGLQMVEGRVDFAPATLIGLALYFGGAILAAFGAVAATASSRQTI